MKKIVVIFLISGLFINTSCNLTEQKTTKEIIIKKSDIINKTVRVKGMTCVGCEVTLEENIAKIEGVVSVKASHTNEEASISYDSTKTTIKAIRNTIKEAGYQAK